MSGIISFIGWLIVGAVVGWIAGELWVGHGFGLINDMVIGVVGSVIGGFLFGRFIGKSGIGGYISSLLGAIVLIIIAGIIR